METFHESSGCSGRIEKVRIQQAGLKKEKV